jgi:hypothetical protein
MKRTLKALKGHSYGGKFRNPGDVYEATRTDANLMVLLKHSEYYVAPAPTAPAATERPKRPYTRRNQTADKPVGYDTKVMTAE